MEVEKALCKKNNWTKVIIGAIKTGDNGVPVRQLIYQHPLSGDAVVSNEVTWQTEREIGMALDELDSEAFEKGATELKELFRNEVGDNADKLLLQRVNKLEEQVKRLENQVSQLFSRGPII